MTPLKFFQWDTDGLFPLMGLPLKPPCCALYFCLSHDQASTGHINIYILIFTQTLAYLDHSA